MPETTPKPRRPGRRAGPGRGARIVARKAETTRECALTREAKPAADLVRFALGPDGAIVPDVDGKAPGRGVWISLSAAAVEEAARNNVFARSLKHKVTVPPDLAQLTASRLEQRLLGALGLALKAGNLVIGATKVRAAIDRPGIIALFTARDAAPDGRRKMMNAAAAATGGTEVPHFELLDSAKLGLALGRENVIHAALTDGAAAHAAVSRAQRLARFTQGSRREETAI